MGFTYSRSERTGKVVLFRSWEYGFSVTLREVVFSAFIVGLMTFFGFLIASGVEKSVRDGQLRYRQAAELMSDAEVEHAMRTDVGDAFASGRFETIDPVSYEHLPGRHLSISADYQHYTMHTRVVHYTTGSGKTRQTHTRIEHYWTWDTRRVDRRSAKRVKWCGSEFPKGKFDYSKVRRGGRIHSLGPHDRIVFTTLPAEFEATAFSEFRGGTVSDGTVLRPGTAPAGLRESMTESHAFGWFWAGWIVLTLVAVGAFLYIDNEWLEDEAKQPAGTPYNRRRRF